MLQSNYIKVVFAAAFNSINILQMIESNPALTHVVSHKHRLMFTLNSGSHYTFTLRNDTTCQEWWFASSVPTLGVEEGAFLQSLGKSVLHTDLHTSQSYTVKPCTKNKQME